MLRSKRIVLLAHCVLNANAKVRGLAAYASVIPFAVDQLSARGYGMIQLPCPELTHAGLRRWEQSLEQYRTPFYRNHCARLLEQIVPQLIEYRENGYQVAALIGIDGSPSCGVHKTCSGDWGGCPSGPGPEPCVRIDGRGIFMECLLQMTEEHGLHLPSFGIDEDDPANSETDLIEFLDSIG
jgi:predicted secreted protein